MRALLLIAFASTLCGDELTQRLAARLAEEADAFQRLAPQVLGRETLHQKTLKPPSRFHLRAGNAAKLPPPPQWREREVTSEYAFAALGGDDQAIHELRQVVTAEGKPVADPKQAQQELAKVITSGDTERKLQLLKDFEKYGLTGAVTDFGQLLLLFHPRSIGRFEFSQRGLEILGDTRTFVFSYKQIDGPAAVTQFEERGKQQVRPLAAEGEIWVRADSFMPIRISLAVGTGDGAAALREEATVNYQMSRFGALLPVSTEHRELRGGQTTMENQFEYSGFQKFGAASDISFEVEK
jgi:hypothetical protein